MSEHDSSERGSRPAPTRELGARGHDRRNRRLEWVTPDFEFDYKDLTALRYFTSDRGKILPRRTSGLSAKQQRNLARSIKRARHLTLLPFTRSQP